MRKIVMVGAGQSSLLLGCDLVARGYDVTIVSDQSAEDFKGQRLARARIMYDRALQYERELGLNFWDEEDPWFQTLHVDFCVTPANRLVMIEGRVAEPGQSIDQRQKFSRWIAEYERRGGKLEIRSLDMPGLEQLAEENDLVIVATWRGTGAVAAELFARDDERSVYTEPPRKHTLLTVRGLKQPSDTLFFTLTANDGDVFRVPFLDPSGERCYNILFEARPGSRMDRFDDVSSPDDVTARAREVFHFLAPWEDERVGEMELVDDQGWSRFALMPIVRKPVGTLPSGRLVLGVGDTLIVNDPVAAQGANLASRMARHVTQRIVEQGDRPFDGDWMQQQFDDFWEQDAKYSCALSNMFLEISKPYKELMLAATQVPAIADAFFDGLNEPQSLWPWIEEVRGVRDYVTQVSGEAWWKIGIRARASVAKGQIAQRLPRRRASVPSPTG